MGIFKKKEALEAPKKRAKGQGIQVDGASGLALLSVAVSIMYANYFVFFGKEDLVSKLMLIPSTLAVIAFLGYKSWK